MNSLRAMSHLPPTALALASDETHERGDEALVLRARDGDPSAANALFRRHARAVVALVIRLSGARGEAEDIAQDAFTEALTDLPSLRDPSAFRPWLLRIAVHQVHRYFRRRRLRRWLGLERGDDEVTLASLAADTVSPDDRAELARIDEVLRTLPDHERVAWSLRHVEGESLEDAATACGCSLATVKRRIAAAQARVDAHTRAKGATR